MTNKQSEPTSVAREYYNSSEADRFYATIWGGEDIHIGMYENDEESIFDASRRTVQRIIALLPPLTEATRVLDLGAGYGGAARHLAERYPCKIACLNLSEVQNKRNRERNTQSDLDDRIEVFDGDFESIPFPKDHFDVVWSQDAILHSGDRERVLNEIDRVLKPGGLFVFTDPMQANDCPPGVLQPVLDRIHLDTMGSPEFYRTAAKRLGWTEINFVDSSANLPVHYGRVLREVERREPELHGLCSPEFVARMKAGLGHWIEAGKQGHLCWGIFLFQSAPRREPV